MTKAIHQIGVLLVAVIAIGSGLASSGINHGRYVGRLVARLLPDGRTMELVEPFAYIEPIGLRWDAPVGSVVDGASIPRMFWRSVGGPFEGKYRDASVIHDVACVNKKRPWQHTHLTFYNAMLASGVEETKAKLMYAAVYHFGPRWDRSITPVVVQSDDERGEVFSKLASAQLENEMLVVTTEKKLGFDKPVEIQMAAVYRADQQNLTPADFEELRREIEGRGLTLNEIENYAPGAATRSQQPPR